MLIKAGVDISRLNREIRRALNTIDTIHHSYGIDLVITSTFEGNHGAGSLHYANDAIDIRILQTFKNNVFADLRDRLGNDFDVVLERDHIHIEYDPK